MNIITAYARKNRCYQKATLITPVGILVHSTGANNPYLKRYVDCESEVGKNAYGNHWNRSDVGVCVHSFIGYDKNKQVRVANILPYNFASWGCGKGSKGSFNYNPTGHLQFEMCEDDLTNKEYCMEVFNTAVDYCVELCKRYEFNPLKKNVIVSHREAHALGYASNHGDPDNWWGKYGLTMDKFRQDVASKLKGTDNATRPAPVELVTPLVHEEKAPTPVNTDLVQGTELHLSQVPMYTSSNAVVRASTKSGTYYVWGAAQMNKRIRVTNSPQNVGKQGQVTGWIDVSAARQSVAKSGTDRFQPYLAKVTTGNLNIRRGAGTNFAMVGTITNRGTYTIVDEASGRGSTKGWGLLKSYETGRNGWISLDYTQKK